MEPIDSSAEHSPWFPDKTEGWSWNQFENEVNFTDSSTELCGLMEDKEIASRAVAFVVNSTRKGIVPLCADVANLMRSKQCLEKKLSRLKRETDAFMSSTSAGSVPGHSMSPTPPSLSSYTENCIKALQEQSMAAQGRYRSSSRCSNSSSAYSYSPKMDNPRAVAGSGRAIGVQCSPATSHDSRLSGLTSHDGRKHGSPGSTRSSGSVFKDRLTSQRKTKQHVESKVTDKCSKSQRNDAYSDHYKPCASDEIKTKTEGVVEDHVVIDIENLEKHDQTNELIKDVADVETFVDESNAHDIVGSICDNRQGNLTEKDWSKAENDGATTLLQRRRISLPEIASIPNTKPQKIRSNQSKQVQCCLSRTERSADVDSLEEQFVRSVKLNAKLEEDLSEARKEIDRLKKRLRLMESTGAIPKTTVYTNYSEHDKMAEDNGYYTGSNRTSRNSSEHDSARFFKKNCPRRQAATPVSYGGPLPGCKCSECLESMGSDDDMSHYSDIYIDEPHRYAVNSKLQVQLADHVITKGNYSGHIRYVGHIDRSDQSSTLFIGLELDTEDGEHDGYFLGKRYFCCKKNYGIFVPINDITGKVNKKVPLKLSKDDATKSKRHSRKITTKDDKITHL